VHFRIGIAPAFAALGFLLAINPAIACGSEARYNKAQELAAIGKALKEAAIPPSDRSAIQALYEKSLISPDAMGLVGLQLQEQYRSQAMSLLHLPRIPAKPARELDAINQALLRLDASDEQYGIVKAMMADAERLWISGSYDAYSSAISTVLNKLQLRVAHNRC
jgi:hypothetical protein